MKSKSKIGGGGIFKNLDTTQAEKAANDRDKMENDGDGDDDGAEFNMDDFLKQGGINLEDELEQ